MNSSAQTTPIKWHKIGEVARKLEIAVETIRMYEREGLFIPEKTASGQRLFHDGDIFWLGCIRRLITEQGLNIEGIRRMLALIPCWNIKPCTPEKRNLCPAFSRSIKPCWMIKTETTGNCISDNCRDCNVYMNALNCENLKALLFHT